MTAHTPATLATELGTSAKHLRKFLRADFPRDQHPGKGNRWALDLNKREVASLRKRYDAWNAAEAAKRTAAMTPPTPAPATPDEPQGDSVETVNDLDAIDGPTDDELNEMIDSELDA